MGRLRGGRRGGAACARLFSVSPLIQQGADLIGLSVVDFAALNPDYVQEYAASWDHKLWSADSPLYAGILMHHMRANRPEGPAGRQHRAARPQSTRPTRRTTGSCSRSTSSTRTTGPLAQFQSMSGMPMSTTHSFDYIGHIEAPSNIGFHAIAAAGLFSSRKVIVTLSSLTMNNDRELRARFNTVASMGQDVAGRGVGPGTSRIRPHTMPTFGQTALVNDDEIAYRSPDLYTQSAGTTDTRGVLLFAGPVFDGQTSFQLDATIYEVDLYPRWSVNEATMNTPNRPLASYSGVVTLTNQMLSLSTTYADATITCAGRADVLTLQRDCIRPLGRCVPDGPATTFSIRLARRNPPDPPCASTGTLVARKSSHECSDGSRFLRRLHRAHGRLRRDHDRTRRSPHRRPDDRHGLSSTHPASMFAAIPRRRKGPSLFFGAPPRGGARTRQLGSHRLGAR